MTDEELTALDEDLGQMREDTLADLREHGIDPEEYAVDLSDDEN